MFKLLVPLIIVLALVGGGFFLYKNLQKTPTHQLTSESTPTAQVLKTPVPTTSPATSNLCEILTKGGTDVPPLYSGIQWQQPTVTEYEVPLGSDIGSRVMSGCLVKSVTSDEAAIKVRNYYLETLDRVSWKMIVQGDAPFGGLDSYQKDKGYFVVNLEADTNLPPQKVLTLFYTQ